MKLDIHDLGKLFEEVQLTAVLSDGKTFPDCIPMQDLIEIKKRYESASENPDFDLRKFIDEHFQLPKSYSTGYVSGGKSIEQHFEQLWDVLTRSSESEVSSLIPLPNPYIVPGGRFREIYYWDSYFTMLGLRASGKVDRIENMVDNFAYLIDEVGYIPNGNRTYFVGRSQPPFFSLMIKLLAEVKGNTVLTKYRLHLEKEYDFWMAGADQVSKSEKAFHRAVCMPDGSILNRYWDEHATPRPESYKEDVELAYHATQRPEELYRHLRAAAESGWDFSSRWFKDVNSFASIHTTDIVPVDLNCLLFHLEKTLEESHRLSGDADRAAYFLEAAERRQASVLRHCWNEKEGFYFDYDFREGKQKDQLTLAGVFPLFFKMSFADQAEHVARVIQEKFLKPGGLITTLNFTGQQWDAPNGWAPLQWTSFQGLKHYKLDHLANQIRTNWMNLNRKVYESTGKLTEKYNVCDDDGKGGGGEYPNQDGFGWTNGVFLAMLKSD